MNEPTRRWNAKLATTESHLLVTGFVAFFITTRFRRFGMGSPLFAG